MKSLTIKCVFLLAAALFLAACATTPPVGSKKWHGSRLLEIETAYENNEISKETYLTLKSETDQMRVQYQENRQRLVNSRRYLSYPHSLHHR